MLNLAHDILASYSVLVRVSFDTRNMEFDIYNCGQK